MESFSISKVSNGWILTESTISGPTTMVFNDSELQRFLCWIAFLLTGKVGIEVTVTKE